MIIVVFIFTVWKLSDETSNTHHSQNLQQQTHVLTISQREAMVSSCLVADLGLFGKYLHRAQMEAISYLFL